jgi:predicted nucleic acid-binding protein
VRRTFVADASVAVAWIHPDQGNDDTSAMLDALEEGAAMEVPALWPLEVANALLMLVRRRKLTDDDRTLGLQWLGGLPVRVDHEMAALTSFSRLSEIAVKHGLSVYDAAYLELALRRALPLGCKDGPLRDAARRAGVSVWK